MAFLIPLGYFLFGTTTASLTTMAAIAATGFFIEGMKVLIKDK